MKFFTPWPLEGKRDSAHCGAVAHLKHANTRSRAVHDGGRRTAGDRGTVSAPPARDGEARSVPARQPDRKAVGSSLHEVDEPRGGRLCVPGLASGGRGKDHDVAYRDSANGEVNRIVLPIATPSLNKLLGMHPMARHRLGKKLAIVVALCGRGTPKATGKRYLTIERHGKRELDKDNAYGGCKPLIDAIKRCGLIIDDNPANVELEVVQVKLAKGEKPHTVITLADVFVPQ